MKSHRFHSFIPLLRGLAMVLALLPASTLEAREKLDLIFAKVGGQELKLDLFLPEGVSSPPLVVFIHGGGWKGGSYKGCKVKWLVDHGFAVASISYRFSDVGTFPAQIHDCKGAIRWLRAHAKEHGYDAKKIGVCGTSAGGHLALLLGTSAGVESLEGTVGGNLNQSSQVQAVGNYYGPTDFVLRSRTQPAKTEEPSGSAYLLLGGKASEQVEKAKSASGAWHVTKGDPPLLNFHGRQDKTVLFDQAERIRDAYREFELPIEFVALEKSGHGGKEFFLGDNKDRVVAFFEKHLRHKK